MTQIKKCFEPKKHTFVMNMTTPADVNHLSLKGKRSPLPLQRIILSQTFCALPFRKPRTGILHPLPSPGVNSKQQELIK